MELSKGVNRDRNAIQQILRRELFHRRTSLLRADATEDEIEDLEAIKTGRIPERGPFADFRGRKRCGPNMFGGYSDLEIARICHIIRDFVKSTAPQNADVKADYDALEEALPVQSLTPHGLKV